MTTRRRFLGAILAAAAAPAVVKAGILMPTRKIITPPDPWAEIRKVGGTIAISNSHGLRPGDVITISGVNDGSEMLRQFVVTGVTSGHGIITALWA